MALNWLGLDYGTRRIGLALGNEAAKLARPLRTLENDDNFLPVLEQLVADEEIDGLVVGLPRSLEGDDTPQTTQVREFALQLEELGLSVRLQDEAATSSLNEDAEDIDAAAAALILQDYLDQV